MNSIMIGIIIFLAGAIIGHLATLYELKKQLEQANMELKYVKRKPTE